MHDENDTDVIDRPKDETKKAPPPKNWKVIIHNDDYTPADFVVHVIAHVFRKTGEEAFNIMKEAHKSGKAIAGTYPFQIAETKSAKANDLGTQYGHPFKTTLESE
jgi:ATP-dependent Clp protease adaptor protein ClpS